MVSLPHIIKRFLYVNVLVHKFAIKTSSYYFGINIIILEKNKYDPIMTDLQNSMNNEHIYIFI